MQIHVTKKMVEKRHAPGLNLIMNCIKQRLIKSYFKRMSRSSDRQRIAPKQIWNSFRTVQVAPHTACQGRRLLNAVKQREIGRYYNVHLLDNLIKIL